MSLTFMRRPDFPALLVGNLYRVSRVTSSGVDHDRRSLGVDTFAPLERIANTHPEAHCHTVIRCGGTPVPP
jgi:hypothetical protein